MTAKEKSTLRFITCGSVDDGKSTLIGRLLYESKLVFQDQLQKLNEDNEKFGTQKNKIDFALLVDGLAAEREQGITIDVAYRFFSTKKRKFIVADTPGHEQYTRNMATGASTADLAIILVDARKGILTQTKRHTFITSLLGIKHIILAVNKLDLMGYDEKVFKEICNHFKNFSKDLNIKNIEYIPISGLNGDNIILNSKNMPWYKGLTLIENLEKIDIIENKIQPLRMVVQHVIRPDQDFRGYAGTINSGTLKKAQSVKILPSGYSTEVDKIFDFKNEIKNANTNQAITLTLKDNLDVSRGDFIVDAKNPPEMADQFRIDLIWMDKNQMISGKSFVIKLQGRMLKAKILIKHEYDINNFSKIKATSLSMNEIGACDIIFEKPIVFEKYDENRNLGALIVIDPETNNTSAAGRINYPLRRSTNIHFQALDINKSDRSALKSQKPCVLWFTGLSGSGKSTIANKVEQKLNSMNFHTMLLDGDNVRHGLNKDLGFTDQDRIENIRRITEVAKLMTEAGLITLVSFISPFTSDRNLARKVIDKNEFVEIHVDVSIEEAEKRDPKGLYKKARSGLIPNFTGINSPYEPPEKPEIYIDSAKFSPEMSSNLIIDYLERKNLFFNS